MALGRCRQRKAWSRIQILDFTGTYRNGFDISVGPDTPGTPPEREGQSKTLWPFPCKGFNTKSLYLQDLVAFY